VDNHSKNGMGMALEARNHFGLGEIIRGLEQNYPF